MTDKEFDNLTQVITNDEWIISTDNNGKYYVKDNYKPNILEVELVHKSTISNQVVLVCDYNGESDDMNWYMSFNVKRR